MDVEIEKAIANIRGNGQIRLTVRMGRVVEVAAHRSAQARNDVDRVTFQYQYERDARARGVEPAVLLALILAESDAGYARSEAYARALAILDGKPMPPRWNRALMGVLLFLALIALST